MPELSASVAAWSFPLPFIGEISPFKEFGIKCLAATVIILLTAHVVMIRAVRSLAGRFHLGRRGAIVARTLDG